MKFQVSNTHDGYIVKVYIVNDFSGLAGNWRPLRNFGDRQGDAIDFKNIDCPNLSNAVINMLIKNFDKDTKYIRVNSSKFIKQ